MSHSSQPHELYMNCTCRAPTSMGFSRQDYCSGLPFPSPGDLPNPGIEPESPALQADSLLSEPLQIFLWDLGPQTSGVGREKPRHPK